MDNYNTSSAFWRSLLTIYDDEFRTAGTIRANCVDRCRKKGVPEAMVTLKNAPREKLVLLCARHAASDKISQNRMGGRGKGRRGRRWRPQLTRGSAASTSGAKIDALESIVTERDYSNLRYSSKKTLRGRDGRK